MRKQIFFSGVLLLMAPMAAAHPGVGIVMDSRGNVFYTDLSQVWKIEPGGRKTIAVANVHTHELYLDDADNLYGEHLWYEGEATNKWGHYIWKLHAEGRLERIIPAREGFRENYRDCSFVRDRAANMYWAERQRDIATGEERIVIQKRTASGDIIDLCRTHDFRDVRWMTCSADGIVYLIDDGDLRRIDADGTVSKLAQNLLERRPSQIAVNDRHSLMGLWLDRNENVYVAVYAGRLVKRVSHDGSVAVVARSNAPWSPTGGMVAPNGDLWLLEVSTTNAVRVRHIKSSGTETIF